MLLENEKHKRLHSIGPKDLKWETREKAVAMVSIVKSLSEGEQYSCQVPIFETDTRSDVEDRVGFVSSLFQDRMEEMNEAWAVAEEENRKEKEALLKQRG